MNAEQIRARLAAIAARLEEIQASEEGYTEEQMTEIDTLNAEFKGLNSQLETAEKVEEMKAKATQSKGRKTESPAPATVNRVEVGKTLNEKFGGFNSSGEFLMAVKRAGQTGELAKPFQNSAAYEKVGEDGGFLVPEEISTAILKKLEVKESLMSYVNPIQVSGNSLTVNVDESQPWNQGVQAYWTAEGATITGSKPSFKQASFRLQKLACMVTATDELLDDATALGSYIQTSAPLAFMNKINGAIISGNGAGKPQGIINSPFAVTTPKESMQSADTVEARNIIKMYSRMFPTSRSNGIWLYNAEVEEQLFTMVDDNDNFLYIGPGGFGNQLTSSPFGTLMGRPAIPMMSAMPALGDLGDIVFVDLSYYWMIRKAAGIKSATSIHLLFDKEQTAFRFSMRLDGKCPFQAPVTTEFGSYDMSAIVLLEAR
jgi:HK97 family phage major capsid protein